MRCDSFLFAVCIAAFVSAACGDLGARTEHFVVRDSAGIEIVENLNARWAPGQEWRTSSQPLVSIGEIDGPDEYQLFRVSGAVRLRDGRLVVANGGTQQLRFYDGDGSFLTSVGSRGEGPAEFQGMGWVRPFSGDSLAVFDFQLNRVSVFDADGRFGRIITIPSGTIPGVTTVLGPVGRQILLTGVLSSPGDRTFTSGRRDTVLVKLFDPDRDEHRTVARALGAGMHVSSAPGGLAMGITIPFGSSPQFAVSANGFFHGSNDEYDVGWYDAEGNLRRRVRRAVPMQVISGEQIAAYKERRIEGMSDPGRRSTMERLLSEVQFPSTFPAYQSLMVDGDGNLWVREYAVDTSEPQDWTVFDAAGRMLGTLRLAGGTVLREIGSDYVLVTERDELDVEYVRLYRLIKPEP